MVAPAWQLLGAGHCLSMERGIKATGPHGYVLTLGRRMLVLPPYSATLSGSTAGTASSGDLARAIS
jgi:hypothetical protein